MNILAIIPARGGSKGIKRKNLVEVDGKSLVEHSIAHALEAQKVARVCVSTDDPEIAELSKKCGAEVPFMRPAELAEDHVLDYPVFQHAADYYTEHENYRPDIIVHLRPTAPYRKAEWIDSMIDTLIASKDADSIRSVSEPAQHPYRVFEIDESGFLDPVMKHRHDEPYLLRRQDLPKMYYYNCVIDVTRFETLQEQKSMTGKKILPYVMDPNEVMDIDTPRDLDFARFIMEKMHK